MHKLRFKCSHAEIQQTNDASEIKWSCKNGRFLVLKAKFSIVVAH